MCGIISNEELYNNNHSRIRENKINIDYLSHIWGYREM